MVSAILEDVAHRRMTPEDAVDLIMFWKKLRKSWWLRLLEPLAAFWP
jgi:hypothetical protein